MEPCALAEGSVVDGNTLALESELFQQPALTQQPVRHACFCCLLCQGTHAKHYVVVVGGCGGVGVVWGGGWGGGGGGVCLRAVLCGTSKQIHGSTLLHLAVEMDRRHMVELLLTYGASVNARKEVLRPWWWSVCVVHPFTALVLMLWSHAQRSLWTPLHEAVDRGNMMLVTTLLNSGADTNSQDQVRCSTGCGGAVQLHVRCLHHGETRLTRVARHISARECGTGWMEPSSHCGPARLQTNLHGSTPP